MMLNLEQLVRDALQDRPPLREVAYQILKVSDEDTLKLVDAAWRVRRYFFGNRVKVNVLLNAKSGLCPEDCYYCSQSRISTAKISRYRILSVEQIVERARQAWSAGAQRFCIVTSGRAPTPHELETVMEATRRIKAELPLEVCACMGFLTEEQARQLKRAGVDAYNHNLNTSARFYSHICTTHTWQERVETVEVVRRAGLQVCCGVIIGMGESDEDVVDMAYSLRQVGAQSIPVNFLIPIEGTPLGNGQTVRHLTPWACLRYLCLFRFVSPRAELRVSAGREHHLRTLQPLALLVANSIFLGDYLTVKGQSPAQDWQMVADLGLVPDEVACSAT